jgi:hypothetical protein
LGRQLAHTYGGDLASTDWRHLGRLAGFRNHKPQRRTASGSAPWVRVLEAQAILASAAQDLLHSATQIVARQATAYLPHRIDSGLHTRPPFTITAHAAAQIYRSWIDRWHIQERFPQVDWSIVDLWLARKFMAIHITPAQVETILRLGSPDFPRHHNDPEDYLRRTLARAALPAPRRSPTRSTSSTSVSPSLPHPQNL